jgi:hypothetical protein
MSSSDRPSKVSSGVDRSFESIDVRHPLYPVALYLFRERFYNSYRHRASEIKIDIRKINANGLNVEMLDNSDGRADVNRLLEPSDESGATTSQYAFGERLLRLKTSDRTKPSTYAWKKEGDMFYNVLTQSGGRYKTETTNIGPDKIWSTPESHGFYSKFELLVDRLEGRDPAEIVQNLRSILSMSLTKKVLDSMHIRIEVRDENGQLLREPIKPGKPTKTGKPRKTREPRIVGLGDSKEENWKSLVETIRDNPHDVFRKHEVEGILSTGATIRVEYSRLKPPSGKPYYDGQKEYTEKKSSAALLVMHDFVVPIPLAEALGKAPHPASQNGRFAIITITPPALSTKETVGKSRLEIEHLQHKSMITLASSKVTPLASCPIYNEMLNFLRQSKPALWDAFVKSSGASSDSESPASSPASRSSAYVPEFVPSTDTTTSILCTKLREVLTILRSAPNTDERKRLQDAGEAFIASIAA